jgi:hypothetical protein
MKLSAKYIWVIAIFGILVAGAAGWFWYGKKENQTLFQSENNQFRQKPESESNAADHNSLDTSEWKTYRNDALGFDVAYPSAFKVDEKLTDSGRVVSFMEFNEEAKNLSGQPAPGYFPVISIYRWEDINDPDLKGGSWEGEKKYAHLQDFLSDSKHTSIDVIDEVTIDGVKAYVLSMPGGIGYEAIMFKYDGKYYRISFPWTQKPLDDDAKRQFLESIRFVK